MWGSVAPRGRGALWVGPGTAGGRRFWSTGAGAVSPQGRRREAGGQSPGGWESGRGQSHSTSPRGREQAPGAPRRSRPADALMQLRMGLLTPRTAREFICAVSSCSGSSSWRPPPRPPSCSPTWAPRAPWARGLLQPCPAVADISDSLTERPPEWRPRSCSVPPTARCPGSHGGLQRESRATSSSGPQARLSPAPRDLELLQAPVGA